MKHNQKGFAVIETLLILIIIGALCGVGWYVYQAQNKQSQKDNPVSQTNEYKKDSSETDAAKDTDSWFSFTPNSGIYTIKLPDGWTFQHQNDECDCLFSNTTIYKAGTPASIEKVQGGRDGGIGYFISVDQSDNSAERFSQFKEAGEFKTAGFEGKKYVRQQTSEPEAIGLPKGSTEYAYYFVKDGKGISVSYSVTPDNENQLELVEKLIKTLK